MCFFICQNSDRVPRLCAKLLPRIRALAKKKSSFPVVSWEQFVKEVKEINKTADEDGVRNVAFYLNESAEVKENLVQHTWMHCNFELVSSCPTRCLKMKRSVFICCSYSFKIPPVQNTCSVYGFRIFQILYVSLVVSSVLPLLLVPFEHIFETHMCVGYLRQFFASHTSPPGGGVGNPIWQW